MAGNPPSGQTLTPNPNVKAPAGKAGDKWGANGGDINPSSGPPAVLVTLANGRRFMNSPLANNQTVSGDMSVGIVSGNNPDLGTVDDATKQIWSADAQSPNVADSQL